MVYVKNITFTNSGFTGYVKPFFSNSPPNLSDFLPNFQVCPNLPYFFYFLTYFVLLNPYPHNIKNDKKKLVVNSGGRTLYDRISKRRRKKLFKTIISKGKCKTGKLKKYLSLPHYIHCSIYQTPPWIPSLRPVSTSPASSLLLPSPSSRALQPPSS